MWEVIKIIIRPRTAVAMVVSMVDVDGFVLKIAFTIVRMMSKIV